MSTRRILAGVLVYLWLQIVFAAFGGITTLVAAATIMLVCGAIWLATPRPGC